MVIYYIRNKGGGEPRLVHILYYTFAEEEEVDGFVWFSKYDFVLV